MDEFGVLVQSVGFKAHGKSAPMAKLKAKPNSDTGGNLRGGTSYDSSYLPVDELDGIFRSNVSIRKSEQPHGLFGGDDVFAPVSRSNQYEGIDLDSVLNNSNRGNSKGNLDPRMYAGFDVFDDFPGTTLNQRDAVDDLIGDIGLNYNKNSEKKVSEFDDLIPGFGGADSLTKGFVFIYSSIPCDLMNICLKKECSKLDITSELNSGPSKSRLTVEDDPFLAFESSVSPPDTWPFSGSSEVRKNTAQSSFDELDEFVMGWPHNDSNAAEIRTTTNGSNADAASDAFGKVDILDVIFNGNVKQNLSVRPTSTTQVSSVKQTNVVSLSTTSTIFSAANGGDGFASFFGDATSSEEFIEIHGEPIERRRARLKQHMKVKERIAKALNDMNQRDIQTQHEQEEKHRLAETLDGDIRRWAAGKEGNLRALLSSLQQVLWPECGWHPVSLTDLITSDSVKKVYKKANIYVHPDKVQQRGANIKQKFIAEKVFDILKEAWNKFNAEELR